MAITGHFTCDNSYSVWAGTVTGVSSEILPATTSTDAGDIWRGEDLPPIELVSGCYLYICAWSDDDVYQGLLGSFTGSFTIHTGDPRWRVLPTGRNKGDNDELDQAEINAAISAAQPADWVVPFVGDPNTGSPRPWHNVIDGIGPEAHWIWHDSNKDTRAKYPNDPYVPFAGFNHDEFLIFRIPCVEFETPVGDITPGALTYNCMASTHCGPGRLCFDYSLPHTPGAAGQENGTVIIALAIYQNGVQVAELASPMLSSGNDFCFDITPGLIAGLNPALGGFDFVATGNFALGSAESAPIVVGSPGVGIKPGQNNDYQLDCQTCAEIAYAQNVYLSEQYAQKVNKLYRVHCDCPNELHVATTECECECTEVEFPQLEPCISIHWGASPCDCIETDDVEVLSIRVCNCYANVTFTGLTIGHLHITDGNGNPVPVLPDGTPSVQVIPSGPICFGDIPACKGHNQPGCVTREVVLYTRGAVGQSYRLSLEGVCFTVSHHLQAKVCFDVPLCRD